MNWLLASVFFNIYIYIYINIATLLRTTKKTHAHINCAPGVHNEAVRKSASGRERRGASGTHHHFMTTFPFMNPFLSALSAVRFRYRSSQYC